ncbi:MAG: hypothetical protein LBP62_04050 [Clostridiales bacterium]|nr:hypothetical protein [Clostridiales bacterium]
MRTEGGNLLKNFRAYVPRPKSWTEEKDYDIIEKEGAGVWERIGSMTVNSSKK